MALAVDMGFMPSELERRMTYLDFFELIAHHALADHKADEKSELEKEILYDEALEEIERERKARNAPP